MAKKKLTLTDSQLFTLDNLIHAREFFLNRELEADLLTADVAENYEHELLALKELRSAVEQ